MDIKYEKKVIYCSPDPTIKVEPDGLGVLLFQNIKRHADKIAQIDAVTGEEQTYDQLLRNSIRLSKYLKTKNLSREDIVCIYLRNCVDTIVPFLSGLYSNLKVCSIDITLNYKESLIFLKLLKPRLLFCDEIKVEDIERALIELGINCDLVVFGHSEKYQTYFQLINTPIEYEDNFEPVPVQDLFSTAFILFTSGTTSYPKAICCTHYGFMVCNMIFKKGHRFDRSLQFSSLYWISGIISLIVNILDGSTKILCPKFEVVHTLETIQKYKVTYAWLAPVSCQKLIVSKKMPEYDLSTVLSITVAGASLPEELYVKMRLGFPNAVICNTYGMTENSGVIFNFNPTRDRVLAETKINSVGLPMSGSSYKVVDLETKENLGPNKVGEIRVKNLNRMKGYYQKPEVTTQTFDDEGYLCTGDLGYYDEDFCFRVETRINDLIIYRQWRLVPFELNQVLLRHPAVREAALIGLPNNHDREHPMGVVVLKPGSTVTAEELVNYYNERVLEHEKIRAGVKFVKQLPYTSSGKLKRNELLKMHLEL